MSIDPNLDAPLDDEPRRGKGAARDDDEAKEEASFCELCGCSEEDDEDEFVRCEECGRLICSACREEGDDGTPYCADCRDEISEEE